jgi:hypothetical protein
MAFVGAVLASLERELADDDAGQARELTPSLNPPF